MSNFTWILRIALENSFNFLSIKMPFTWLQSTSFLNFWVRCTHSKRDHLRRRRLPSQNNPFSGAVSQSPFFSTLAVLRSLPAAAVSSFKLLASLSFMQFFCRRMSALFSRLPLSVKQLFPSTSYFSSYLLLLRFRFSQDWMTSHRKGTAFPFRVLRKINETISILPFLDHFHRSGQYQRVWIAVVEGQREVASSSHMHKSWNFL